MIANRGAKVTKYVYDHATGKYICGDGSEKDPMTITIETVNFKSYKFKGIGDLKMIKPGVYKGDAIYENGQKVELTFVRRANILQWIKYYFKKFWSRNGDRKN